ncbi:FadR family transcriptional regulator [Rhodobacteraceae bacterium RKSG542]|uniref:FadR/GntR family transcriptional regulator n=1 Tax=Pseudovibrio flavus TaxID=2529854 RepID=UPI0012BC025B|nr:FCD domain-containing protein [Pseudovibrio flavus]MTI18210.1 FadR family transcriptional regulator [Pseudovibrio flavus]
MRAPSVQDLRHRTTEALAKQLFSGQIKPGDFLPKEVDLAEQFSISRATVRGALETFNSFGIIKRISGLGTRVQAYDSWNILAPQVAEWIARYSTPELPFSKEIFDFRAATEPFLAMEAARKATAHDLLLIENAWQGMYRASKSSDSRWRGRHFQEYDCDFHEAIYQASHNLVWVQIARSVRPAVIYIIRQTTEQADELTDSLGRHKALMEAIRLRQVSAAREAALRIIDRTAFDLNLTDYDRNTFEIPSL